MAYQSDIAYFGAQQPLAKYLTQDINSRLGQPEQRTAAVNEVFQKYGDWGDWSKNVVNQAYNPAILKAQLQKKSPFQPVQGTTGAQGFNQKAVQQRWDAKQKFMTDTAMFNQGEARKNALYKEIGKTPQAMDALNKLDVKYSDPTQSSAWQQAKKLLGIDTMENTVYQPWDRPSFGESMVGLGVSSTPLLYQQRNNISDWWSNMWNRPTPSLETGSWDPIEGTYTPGG